MSPASASSVCALEAKPWPVSCMQVRTMICSQPAVGTASSEPKHRSGHVGEDRGESRDERATRLNAEGSTAERRGFDRCTCAPSNVDEVDDSKRRQEQHRSEERCSAHPRVSHS